MIPTWNEAENIGPLIDAILALGPELEALVVDDNSPDETWRVVQGRMAAAPGRVHLLRRFVNRGRGLAGIAGFREALRLGADAVIEMDADWSHDPKWIPSLLAKSREADVVIGSRLVRGGGEVGRPPTRRIVTHIANAYIRMMLRLPVRDATSGFRLFSRTCLERLPWDAMRATGPEVVQEVLLAAHARACRIAEVPILFVERRAGVSTFNKRIALRSLTAMARLRWRPGRLTSDGIDPLRQESASRQQLTPLPAALTLPFSLLYGLGRRLMRAAAVAGLRPRRRLSAPVVCVGNLTVGGTGKTPFTLALAQTLRERGYSPAILSRGYGGAVERQKKGPLVVSDGAHVLATAEHAGDEPRMLAERAHGIAVVTHPNRYLSGLMAIEALDANLLILDDGFQHDRLRRDLDLVLWDVADMPRRMRLLPTGRLREGLGALRRAGAIILTHAEYLPEKTRARRIDEVVQQLRHYAPAVPIFEAETRIAGFNKLSGRLRLEQGDGDAPPRGGAGVPDAPWSAGGGTGSAWPWRGRRVVAVSGVARPWGFESMLRASGAIVAHHFAYPDHYVYDAWLIDHWRETMTRLNAELIVTTGKDAVKLESLPMFGVPALAVSIEMRVADQARWDLFLQERLGSRTRASHRPQPLATPTQEHPATP